ncbi:hypothetical protein DWU98_11180 [Dyella monticola]|uniref:Uncharacterized protein n=1 Tax=Dyella monticola TaxID=1927958 RepID=A0A370WYG6_9GAMM|nr:hypothetical protein [Dyella monticola]RDS81106.1 hypothetical protein DWU98_11180 [Dyella monticola]
MGYEAFDAIEGWESESEGAEAARSRVPRPSNQSSFKPRPPATASYVTQTQLEAALARVDGKIKTVADGMSSINSKVNSLASSFKKEADERKKSVDGQSKDINQKLQMLALLPLLVTPPSVTLASNSIGPGGTNLPSVLVPDTSTMDTLLPLLLVSGMGGSGGLSLGGDSSSDGGMMMLVLALALSKNS